MDKTVATSMKDWTNTLYDAPWAYMTNFKTNLWLSPYHLVCKKEFRFPMELEHKAYWAVKFLNFDEKLARKK